jgi:hypothetical protein
MNDAAGSARGVGRTERRRPEQTDDEGQWKQAFAAAMHRF